MQTAVETTISEWDFSFWEESLVSCKFNCLMANLSVRVSPLSEAASNPEQWSEDCSRMFALPPAARQTRHEEQPAGPTADAPTDRPRDPRCCYIALL